MKTGKTPRLCILATHPIQYAAPWFKTLHESSRLNLQVIYFREPVPASQGIGFDRSFNWDIPLREGYPNKVLDIPDGRYLSLFGIRTIWRALSAQQPDVVLVTGWNEPLLAVSCLLATLQRVPVIMRGESNDLRPRSILAKLAHRVLFLFVDSIIQIGKANRRFYRQSGWPNSKIHGGAYCVDNTRLMAMKSTYSMERDALRASYDFSNEDIVFAFFGKHVSFKRPEVLIEAAALCRSRGAPCKLLFAGEGRLSRSLAKLANKYNVPATFAGFLNQSEIWRLYLAADAFVLPSNWHETWGLVTNEAMLFDLPVIVSDQAGCAEDLIIEGVTGFTFSGGASALAEKMMLIAMDMTYARRIGIAARKHVLSSYSFAVSTDGLFEAIADVGIPISGLDSSATD